MTDKSKRPGDSLGVDLSNDENENIMTSTNHSKEKQQAQDVDGADDRTAADPFDPAKLRLSQDFGAEVGVKKLLTRIPLGKPASQDFFRVNPDPHYQLNTALLELKEDREFYLLAPELRDGLFDEIVFVRLYLTVNRQGVLRLWPGKLPGADGRSNSWYETALQAAELAMNRWIRIKADMSLGGYQTYAATADLPEPEWPDQPFGDLLKIAFGDRYISEHGHVVLKRLRGEA